MSVAITPQFENYLNKRVKVSTKSIQAVLGLAAEGATIPFMARYRKEATGNLDEVQIQAIVDAHESFEELTKRREFILAEVEKQGSLTDELKTSILAADELSELEELYRPYKRKKKTKAKMARDAGLGPLADWIWQVGHGETEDSATVEVKAKNYINPAAGYATYEEALRGAQHIIVERLMTNQDLRKKVKDEFFINGKVISTKGAKYKTKSKYQMYEDFTETVKSLLTKKASHRYMALRRGWQEGELKVTIDADQEGLLKEITQVACTVTKSQVEPILMAASNTALTVHMIPSVANELHSLLKETSDTFAIEVFADNVRQVLMSSPFGPRVILGVDPGLKTGCKIALVDKGGNFISHTVMGILAGEKDEEKAKALLGEVSKQITIEAIAVGNGTGGREAESFLRKVLKQLGLETPVIMVNESGASVYSASAVARDEFPELDLTVRGAISIARRLQDPLSELVKIDPKSIGVGQYQHDVSQPKLKKSLHRVVESCVNHVGVDLNTASSSLLQYVAGIGPKTAQNIVEFRKQNGLFGDRQQLLKVPQFSSKTFEQAAGFLRVAGGSVALDNTGIHPESYQAVKDMALETKLAVKDLLGGSTEKLLAQKEKWEQLVGKYTFADIISELSKPGRDPRDPFKVFKYRDDIHEVADLKKEMICPGIVTNVTNFGAFVDIGVHQDGLVHISELSHDFVSDPKEVVSPGDQVKVKVLDVDVEKKQISLSMLLTEKPKVKVNAKKRPDGKSGGKSKPGGKGGNKGQRPKGPKRPGKGKPNRPQRSPFNNPFAALTDLKK